MIDSQEDIAKQQHREWDIGAIMLGLHPVQAHRMNASKALSLAA